jgi:hypothetical protein
MEVGIKSHNYTLIISCSLKDVGIICCRQTNLGNVNRIDTSFT